MAKVKLSKREFVFCVCKAMVKSIYRSIQRNRIMLRRYAAAGVLAIVTFAFAVPVSLAASNDYVKTDDVNPLIVMADDGAGTFGEVAIVGMHVNINEEKALLENNGYPYGKLTDKGISLAVKLSSDASEASLQWQSSADNAEWTNIDGAVKQSVSAAPKSGTWFRCVVNGEPSKSIQVIGKFNCEGKSEKDSMDRIWTNPLMPWYFSNGSVAYSISSDGTAFDVVGIYKKGDSSYMIQTAYSEGWKMVSSTSDAPGLDYSDARLDEIRVSFSDNNPLELAVAADLEEEQTAFSISCDTMVGNDDTSRAHSDFAALEVNKNPDNTLNSIYMVGAGSSSQAVGSNPGFVISPVTTEGLSFWLGYYNERQHFAFNTGTGNINTDGEYVDNICTEALGLDAGMTMSWMGVPKGDVVEFTFIVGNVDGVGIKKGSVSVNYSAELIQGLAQSTDYIIDVEGEEASYEVVSNAVGHITFSSTDKNGQKYDFAGKRLHITKKQDEEAAVDIEIVARPVNVQSLPDSDEVINIGETSISITIPLGSLQLFAQEYGLYDSSGQKIQDFKWIRPTGDGKLEFTGLDSNTLYSVKARVLSTDSKPSSLPLEVYRFKTK